jgi:hypothetical protein
LIPQASVTLLTMTSHGAQLWITLSNASMRI